MKVVTGKTAYSGHADDQQDSFDQRLHERILVTIQASGPTI
jgi:hypothetical protein